MPAMPWRLARYCPAAEPECVKLASFRRPTSYPEARADERQQEQRRDDRVAWCAAAGSLRHLGVRCAVAEASDIA